MKAVSLAMVADLVYERQRSEHSAQHNWSGPGPCPQCAWATEMLTRLEADSWHEAMADGSNTLNPSGALRFADQLLGEAMADLRIEGCAVQLDARSTPDGMVTVRATMKFPAVFAARLNAAFKVAP